MVKGATAQPLLILDLETNIGRIQVRADNVDEFLNELRIAADFERRQTVRLQTGSAQSSGTSAAARF